MLRINSVIDVSSTNLQQQQTLGELNNLRLLSHQEPDSLTAVLEEWLTIEDDEIIREAEVDMVLEEEQQDRTNDQAHSNDMMLCKENTLTMRVMKSHMSGSWTEL